MPCGSHPWFLFHGTDNSHCSCWLSPFLFDQSITVTVPQLTMIEETVWINQGGLKEKLQDYDFVAVSIELMYKTRQRRGRAEVWPWNWKECIFRAIKKISQGSSQRQTSCPSRKIETDIYLLQPAPSLPTSKWPVAAVALEILIPRLFLGTYMGACLWFNMFKDHYLCPHVPCNSRIIQIRVTATQLDLSNDPRPNSRRHKASIPSFSPLHVSSDMVACSREKRYNCCFFFFRDKISWQPQDDWEIQRGDRRAEAQFVEKLNNKTKPISISLRREIPKLSIRVHPIWTLIQD